MSNNQDWINLLSESLDDFQLTFEEKTDIEKELESIAHNQERLAFIRNQAIKLLTQKVVNESGRKALKCLKNLLVVIDKNRPDTDKVEAFFTHHSDPLRIIQREINQTKKNLDICVFTITDNRITDLILKAHKSGIAVRIITDNEKLHDKGSDIRRLSDAGIEIAIDDGVEHMHHKFAIFDRSRLLNGSYNWTRGASEKNYENFLITDNQFLLTAYAAEFERLWSQFERF